MRYSAVARLENHQPILAMADLDKALALKPDEMRRALLMRAEIRVGAKDLDGAASRTWPPWPSSRTRRRSDV